MYCSLLVIITYGHDDFPFESAQEYSIGFNSFQYWQNFIFEWLKDWYFYSISEILYKTLPLVLFIPVFFSNNTHYGDVDMRISINSFLIPRSNNIYNSNGWYVLCLVHTYLDAKSSNMSLLLSSISPGDSIDKDAQLCIQVYTKVIESTIQQIFQYLYIFYFQWYNQIIPNILKIYFCLFLGMPQSGFPNTVKGNENL